MQFRVRFYETADGQKPLADFLRELKQTQPVLHSRLDAGLKKLRNRQNHRKPLTDCVDPKNDIFGLRVGGTNIARAFFFFKKESQIIVTNGMSRSRRRSTVAHWRGHDATRRTGRIGTHEQRA